MTSVIDLWRAIDPDARPVSGSADALRTAVRGVSRTRAAAPLLPAHIDGELLIADVALALEPGGLDGLVAALHEAGLRPSAVLLAGAADRTTRIDAAGDPLPVLVTAQGAADIATLAEAYLGEPEVTLARLSLDLRLAAAEAALATPEPAAAAGLVAARLRRGLAVSADGGLVTLHPRPAGRALAARFAAIHARLLADAPSRNAERAAEGLQLLQREVRGGASVWLFDDLPFARIDEVAAEALTITLRALLRRPPAPARPMLRLLPPDAAAPAQRAAEPAEPVTDALLWATAVAVARANGRIAPAARELGVHRNTVLYRLRRARHELGVDPRRSDDALEILRREERRRSG